MLKTMAPRLLMLGGGGYNPWTVGRLWSGVRATLNGFAIPDVLPQRAQAVLKPLSWPRHAVPASALLTTPRDVPRTGQVREAIWDLITALKPRLNGQF